jgi:hypothetical protein
MNPLPANMVDCTHLNVHAYSIWAGIPIFPCSCMPRLKRTLKHTINHVSAFLILLVSGLATMEKYFTHHYIGDMIYSPPHHTLSGGSIALR